MLSVNHFFIFLIFGTFCESYDLIVQTNYGKVEGVLKTTRKNGTFVAYSGIPFAKPPVGDLRFALPQNPEPWDGVRNGSKSGSRCIQRNYLFYSEPPVEGSEDCLYLNVYVPANNASVGSLPVFVSIPWGGFFVEGGDEGYFGPEYLLDYDVILVTFNYRVGVFGFISTFDDVVPGNLGMKDQVHALHWVQDNIEYFGGAKENVTLIGQSAGAVSTHLHILSPASRGLFTKAISESGSALGLVSTPDYEAQKNTLIRQAQLVNCSDFVDNSTQLVQCLRDVSAEDLLATQDAFKSFYRFPYNVWSFVVETETENNPNPFLAKTPLEYIEAKEFQNVPWLTGNMKNEGLLVVPVLLETTQEINDFNSSFPTVLSNLLPLSSVTNDTESLYEKVSHLYLGDKNYISSDDQWEQGFMNIWTDWTFLIGTNNSISRQLANGFETIYLYSFEYAGEYTFTDKWINKKQPYNPNWSLSHCDELIYLFKMPDIFEDQLTSESDQAVSDTLLSLWVNFAIYGNPNPPENVILNDVNWEPLKASSSGLLINDDITLLNITGSYKTGANFGITQGFYKERLSFWQNETSNQN